MKKWAGNGPGQLLQMSVGMRQSPYYSLGISTKSSSPLQTLMEATKAGTPDSHGRVHLVVASPPSLCTLQVAAKQLLHQYSGPVFPKEISVTFHERKLHATQKPQEPLVWRLGAILHTMKVSLVHETKSAPKAEKDKGVPPFGLKPPGKRARQNGGAETSAK